MIDKTDFIACMLIKLGLEIQMCRLIIREIRKVQGN